MMVANFNNTGNSIFVHKLKQYCVSDFSEDDERLPRLQL